MATYHWEGADGNLESKSLGCGGICCNGRKLVSVEGGDCSKRSNYLPFFLCLKPRVPCQASLRAAAVLGWTSGAAVSVPRAWGLAAGHRAFAFVFASLCGRFCAPMCACTCLPAICVRQRLSLGVFLLFVWFCVASYAVACPVCLCEPPGAFVRVPLAMLQSGIASETKPIPDSIVHRRTVR